MSGLIKETVLSHGVMRVGEDLTDQAESTMQASKYTSERQVSKAIPLDQRGNRTTSGCNILHKACSCIVAIMKSRNSDLKGL